MPLGIGGEAKPGFGERAACADAGDDILQLLPLRPVIEHVVGGDERHARALGEAREAVDAGEIVAAIEMARGEI